MSDSCNPMDCSPLHSSVHGISQAEILEWVVKHFFRGSFWPRNQACVSCIAGRFFTTVPPGKPKAPRKFTKPTLMDCLFSWALENTISGACLVLFLFLQDMQWSGQFIGRKIKLGVLPCLILVTKLHQLTLVLGKNNHKGQFIINTFVERFLYYVFLAFIILCNCLNKQCM